VATEHGTPTIDDYLAGAIPDNGKLLCPFHDDGRPSAKVLPGSGRFWCHVCGFAEDRRGVAMRLLFPDTFHLNRGQDIAAAITWLDKVGAAPHVHARAQRGPEPIDADAYRVITVFCRHTTAVLARSVEGITELIKTRGLKNPVTMGFGMGHWRLLKTIDEELAKTIPDWGSRKEKLLHTAGITSKKGTYALANRFILPEWRILTEGSALGPAGTRFAAFYQARSREENPKVKFLSPELPKQFWGLESLKRDTGLVFLGEGVFDVAPLVEAGESALAMLGSHLGPLGEQLDGLAEVVGQRLVAICFDNDVPKKNETVGVGHAQALALHARLTGVGIQAAIVHPPPPYHDLGEWLSAVPAKRVAAELKLSL
jgi:hypothetical protein